MKDFEIALAEVIDICAKELSVPKEKIQKEDHISDLVDDSIQLFELLTAFEKHYNIRANYEDVVNLDTVSDIAAYVEQKTNHT